jgi:hypothetical protein
MLPRPNAATSSTTWYTSLRVQSWFAGPDPLMHLESSTRLCDMFILKGLTAESTS